MRRARLAGTMGEGIDHFAMGVRDLDEQIRLLTTTQGWRLIRTGTQYSTGNRIAMLADPRTGFKLELVETRSERPELLHVAYQVEDVDGEHRRLTEAGYTTVSPPHQLKAARAYTALLEDPTGLKVQIIRYDPDSPDR